MAQSSWLNVIFSTQILLPSSNFAASYKDTGDLKYPIPGNKYTVNPHYKYS
jgi:hypothetical protein